MFAHTINRRFCICIRVTNIATHFLWEFPKLLCIVTVLNDINILRCEEFSICLLNLDGYQLSQLTLLKFHILFKQ